MARMTHAEHSNRLDAAILMVPTTGRHGLVDSDWLLVRDVFGHAVEPGLRSQTKRSGLPPGSANSNTIHQIASAV